MAETDIQSAARAALTVNGEPVATSAVTLADLIAQLGYAGDRVATAVNGEFVPRAARGQRRLMDNDRVEIVAPRQGG
jgi:sulfur carrier protein